MYVTLALIALILCGVIFVLWVRYLRNLRKKRRTGFDELTHRIQKNLGALEAAIQPQQVRPQTYNNLLSQLNETLFRGVRREERTRLSSGGWELRITTTTATTTSPEPPPEPVEEPENKLPLTIYERLDKDTLDEN